MLATDWKVRTATRGEPMARVNPLTSPTEKIAGTQTSDWKRDFPNDARRVIREPPIGRAPATISVRHATQRISPRNSKPTPPALGISVGDGKQTQDLRAARPRAGRPPRRGNREMRDTGGWQGSSNAIDGTKEAKGWDERGQKASSSGLLWTCIAAAALGCASKTGHHSRPCHATAGMLPPATSATQNAP